MLPTSSRHRRRSGRSLKLLCPPYNQPVLDHVAAGPSGAWGSFDPFTNGHLDVVRWASALVDELIVGVAASPDKRTLTASGSLAMREVRQTLQ